LKRVYLLMGGIWSWDGYATSSGMLSLVSELRKIPNTAVKWYAWADYKSCFADQNAEASEADRVILIGYSGGGPYCTVIANMMAKYREMVELMVLYDPSPPQWMQRIKSNVKTAWCYENKSPTWFIYPLGGAKLEADANGPHISVKEIDMNHLAVQFDASLHRQTIELVRGM